MNMTAMPGSSPGTLATCLESPKQRTSRVVVPRSLAVAARPTPLLLSNTTKRRHQDGLALASVATASGAGVAMPCPFHGQRSDVQCPVMAGIAIPIGLCTMDREAFCWCGAAVWDSSIEQTATPEACPLPAD